MVLQLPEEAAVRVQNGEQTLRFVGRGAVAYQPTSAGTQQLLIVYNNGTLEQQSITVLPATEQPLQLTGTQNGLPGPLNDQGTGDHDVAAESIALNPQIPIEDESVTVLTNITNLQNTTELTVTVRFIEERTNSSVDIGEQNISIDPLGTNTTQFLWSAKTGNTTLRVVVDPYNSIVELNESNNNISTKVFVSPWQTFFGNIYDSVALAIGDNSTFASWALPNMTHNIYATDADMTDGITFTALRALGRDTDNGSSAQTQDDFEEVDTALNLTDSDQNINITYTDGGAPRQVQNITVFGRAVQDVPMTSSGNATTGILWDSSDSSNAYYDLIDWEDLVWVTETNDTYELRIPSALRNYKGAISQITLYYEIK